MSTVLNGASSLTEAARLRKMLKGHVFYKSPLGNPDPCCVLYPQSAQAPITPTESSRILSLSGRCGSALNGAGVSQERARELLAALGQTPTNFGSEGVRIDRLIQDTNACSEITPFTRPIIPVECPPLPPPPAPPARACPPTKNTKPY